MFYIYHIEQYRWSTLVNCIDNNFEVWLFCLSFFFWCLLFYWPVEIRQYDCFQSTPKDESVICLNKKWVQNIIFVWSSRSYKSKSHYNQHMFLKFITHFSVIWNSKIFKLLNGICSCNILERKKEKIITFLHKERKNKFYHIFKFDIKNSSDRKFLVTSVCNERSSVFNWTMVGLKD